MSLIKQPYEAAETSIIRALIYGQPGIGKTTLALTAPNALLIDCDNGISRVNPSHRTPYITANSWADIEALFKEDLKPFDTVIIDTVGKLLDLLGEDIIENDYKMGRKDGALALQGYQALKARFSKFLKLLQGLNKHILLVCHDKEQSGDGDELIVRPDVTGSSLGLIMREMDIVGYYQSVNNKRVLCMDPTDKFYAKNTALLPGHLEIKTFDDTPGRTLTEVFKAYKDKQNAQTEIKKEYDRLVDFMSLLIAKIKTPAHCTKAATQIKELPVIWDSNLVARSLFGDCLKTLNLRFNADTKKYVPVEKPQAQKAPKSPEMPQEPQFEDENKPKPTNGQADNVNNKVDLGTGPTIDITQPEIFKSE